MNQYFVIFKSQCAAFTPKNSLILIHIFQRLKIHFIYFSSLILLFLNLCKIIFFKALNLKL
jgi:hypothetical protein